MSENKDGSPLISFFGKYDPSQVSMRLDFGLGWLLQSARMIHGAFQVRAPELDELAGRFEQRRGAGQAVGAPRRPQRT